MRPKQLLGSAHVSGDDLTSGEFKNEGILFILKLLRLLSNDSNDSYLISVITNNFPDPCFLGQVAPLPRPAQCTWLTPALPGLDAGSQVSTLGPRYQPITRQDSPRQPMGGQGPDGGNT